MSYQIRREWHYAEQRLPPINTPVLVYDTGVGEVCLGYLEPQRGADRPTWYIVSIHNEPVRDTTVTWWASMPESPYARE